MTRLYVKFTAQHWLQALEARGGAELLSHTCPLAQATKESHPEYAKVAVGLDRVTVVSATGSVQTFVLSHTALRIRRAFDHGARLDQLPFTFPLTLVCTSAE